MKQLFFILHGKNDNYNLAGIFGSREKAMIAVKRFTEDNGELPGNDNYFDVKIYSGNFGIVEIGKEIEK